MFIKGKCHQLAVQLGNFTTELDAYVLELGGLDMIMGVEWLQRFGKVTFDLEHMTISFQWKETRLELLGQSFNHPKVEKIHKLMSSFISLLEERETLNTGRNSNGLKPQQQMDIEKLLNGFSSVFEERSCLPPKRDNVHTIELHQNVGPVR